MLELHQRVSPSEIILGWFATGSAMYNSDALIQEFYSKAGQYAMHLKVDTTLSNKRFSIAAYQARTLQLKDRPVATEFVELPCEVLFSDVERAGVDLMSGLSAPKPLSEAEGLASSLSRLEGLMDTVHKYVEDVVEGRRKGDPAVGRYIADTLAVVPRFSKLEFERLFSESMQDALMVTYLSNLLRAQIALAEKLGTSQLPIMGPHSKCPSCLTALKDLQGVRTAASQTQRVVRVPCITCAGSRLQ